jgi:hypothetical protein
MDNFVLYVLVISAITYGLTMLALIDIIKKDFGSLKIKVIWHFVALIPIIGWLVYLLFGYKKGLKR